MENNSMETVGKDWGWVLAAGLALVVIGIIALNWPVSSTVGLTFALSVVLMASGMVHAIDAVQMRHKGGNAWRILHTVVAFAAGILMLRYPGAGMVGVAIAMTLYFFVSSAAKTQLALSLRPVRGWGWIMASAVCSAILGVYILATLPLAALWIPGFILGIDLIVYGASLVGISLDLKHIHRSVSQISPKMATHTR
jgi:uncharacterized membrane protein HdeD (DUF308 family)